LNNIRTVEGRLTGEGHRYAIVVSRFNSFITEQLVKGAVDGLRRSGVSEDDMTILWVPGAWEIPVVARRAASSGAVDGVICLGAVIRGNTPHFDYVANEVSKGTAAIAQSTGVPILFGVITTDTIEQAVERAGTKMGNKGFESALSGVEMVNLLRAADGAFAELAARGQG